MKIKAFQCVLGGLNELEKRGRREIKGRGSLDRGREKI